LCCRCSILSSDKHNGWSCYGRNNFIWFLNHVHSGVIIIFLWFWRVDSWFLNRAAFPIRTQKGSKPFRSNFAKMR
jgi:hypothetical protein